MKWIIAGFIAAMVFGSSTRYVDCNTPDTWSTPSGVRACAINHGE